MRSGRDEGREVVTVPVGIEGVLALRVGAQAVLQLAVHMAVVGVIGYTAGIGYTLGVRVEPLHYFIIRVASLKTEAFLHFHLNASLITSRI
jgi:hypothetical protein